MVTFRDYTAEAIEACRAVLIELVYLMGEFRDHLVVVGAGFRRSSSQRSRAIRRHLGCRSRRGLPAVPGRDVSEPLGGPPVSRVSAGSEPALPFPARGPRRRRATDHRGHRSPRRRIRRNGPVAPDAGGPGCARPEGPWVRPRLRKARGDPGRGPAPRGWSRFGDAPGRRCRSLAGDEGDGRSPKRSARSLRTALSVRG